MSRVAFPWIRVAVTAAFFPFLASAVGALQQPWTIEVVDAGGQAGFYSSVEVDAAGVPQIAYFDDATDKVRYARRSPTTGAWEIQTLESSSGWVSLAVDGSDNPHIAHQSSAGLRYGRWTGSAWVFETVDSIPQGCGWGASIALDAAGSPRISYGAKPQNKFRLKYARRVGTSWVLEVVDPQNGSGDSAGTSLALDGAGNPRIAYHNGNAKSLRYASWDGAQWVLQTVDSGSGTDVGLAASLALDAGGNPRMTYVQTNASLPHLLKYAEWNGSAWSVEGVDLTGHPGAGSRTSLALDASGTAHVSYRGSPTAPASLMYARRISGTWTIEQVDAASAGYWNSLALDVSGVPHISYRGNGTILKYATHP